jgi:hypothetical protein
MSSEELKKEFWIALRKSPMWRDSASGIIESLIDDLLLQALAKQQEEFVKRIEEEAVKVCKGDDDCIDTFSEIFADIKSKLNI